MINCSLATGTVSRTGLMQCILVIMTLAFSAFEAQSQQPVEVEVEATISRIAEERSRFGEGGSPPWGHFLNLMTHGHQNYVLYPEGVSDRRYMLVVTRTGISHNAITGITTGPEVTASLSRQDLINGKTRHGWVVRFPLASPVKEVPFEGGTLTKYFAFLGIRIDRRNLPREVLHTLDSVKGFAGYQYHWMWAGYRYFYVHPFGSPTKASFEEILIDVSRLPAITQPYRLPDEEIEFIRRSLGRKTASQHGASVDDEVFGVQG